MIKFVFIIIQKDKKGKVKINYYYEDFNFNVLFFY